LIPLEITEPWIQLGFNKVRADQGTAAELAAAVTVAREFEGEAGIELLGLPNNVAAEKQAITKDAKELKYAVNIAADSPVGKHTNVLARATIMAQGEPVIHNLYGIELRIDKPLPPPKDAPPPPPPTADGQQPEPTPVQGPVRGARKFAVGIAPFDRGSE
jgi:hypothetical protein